MRDFKKYLIIFLFVLFTFKVSAQIDTNYVWSYQLKGEAWQDWDSINHVWMNDVYAPCLKANKLKMSCAKCVYIYIDAGFTIDECGKLVDIKIFKENVCSKKASEKLKKCFFDYFLNMVFPISLRNNKIISKFGTGLKC